MNDFTTVARLADLHPDRALSVKVEGREIALFVLEGKVFALDARCPHRGGPLGEAMLENGKAYCPMHGWEFDVRTGACHDNPERPARCYAVQVIDDQVQIKL
jgi:nitrite reductase/ring-hydroxylating ferredoxin subunit